MADKQANPQPQSGAGKKEREDFTLLPDDKNKDEVGQDNATLAPLLHWGVDAPSSDE